MGENPEDLLKSFADSLEGEDQLPVSTSKPKSQKTEPEEDSDSEEEGKKPSRKRNTELQDRIKKMEEQYAELLKQNAEIKGELEKNRSELKEKKDYISISFPSKKGSASSVMFVPIKNIEKMIMELDSITVHNPSLQKAWESISTMNTKIPADCTPKAKTDALSDAASSCEPKGLFRDPHFRALYNDVARHLRKTKTASGETVYRPTQVNDLEKLAVWAESFTLDLPTIDAFKIFIREYLFGSG